MFTGGTVSALTAEAKEGTAGLGESPHKMQKRGA